jgi:transposase-like protein
MARRMAELVLGEAERTELKLLSSRRKTAQALALRARIVLECARGLENQEVAASLGIAKNTVGKWRRRFVERGMDGLHDEARSGAPRSIEDDRIEGGHCEDFGKLAGECHALEFARHGQGQRPFGL